MTNATSHRTIWLLLHDEEFLHKHRTLDPVVFPQGPMRFLVTLAMRQWADYRTTLTATVLNQALDAEASQLRKARATAESVARVYLDLDAHEPEESGLPYVREVCAAWLEQYVLSAYVEKAGGALERGDVGGAREALTASMAAEPGEDENLKLSDFLGRGLPEPRPGVVPTGLYELDRLWGGGVRPGELGLLLGPTNVGKSMVAVHLAVQAYWKNRSTLYYTFELTPEQILQRAITGIVESGPTSLGRASKDTSSPELWAKELTRAARERHLSEAPTCDIDVRTGLVSIRGLIHDIDQYIAEHGQPPGLLILDSADELAPERKQQATWEELRDIFTTLRGEVAQGRNLPVWTTGQATREAVDKARISLKHVGGAFAKAQRAHYVLGLAQTDQELQHEDGPYVNVYVLKDTLHGTKGAWLRCRSTFGRGGDGWPGLETMESYGLPVSVGREEEDPR